MNRAKKLFSLARLKGVAIVRRIEARAISHRTPCLLVATALFALLLFLRHPAGLLNANFWAEDGWLWYPNAYTLGPASLFQPHTGYLQTFSRLIALLAQPFPLLWAPTIFAVAAFIVRLLPAALLLSTRLDAAWPSLPPIIPAAATDWPYPHMRQTDFNQKARQFPTAPPGTRMDFQIHPPGATPMRLIKR